MQTTQSFEIIHQPSPGTDFRYALFDFDGTLSLIRAGWQEIMIPYFTEVLLSAPQAEGREAAMALVTEFVDRLTGKQTIFQCIELNAQVVKRGGAAVSPGIYKAEYLHRLERHIDHRLQDLRAGCDPERYLVPGSVALLTLLKAAGFHLYLASGTDEADVRAEARLLGLHAFFGESIHGARDDMTDCSKELVIKQILSDNRLSGAELLSFGDGFVEIELVAALGGYAIGAATDETGGEGVNLHKRARLLEAGASMIVPHFKQAEALVALFIPMVDIGITRPDTAWSSERS